MAPEDDANVGFELRMTCVVTRFGKAVGHFNRIILSKPHLMQRMKKDYPKLIP